MFNERKAGDQLFIIDPMAYKFQKCFDVAIKLVEEGGQLIKSRIRAPKSISTKTSRSDFVTETDQEVEDLIISGLKCSMLDENFQFIAEETAAKEKKPLTLTTEPTWIIDPVDGTMNFVHGNPHVAISVGFYNNKEPEFGIIYMPLFDKIFTAIKGQGAKLNNHEIKVSSVKELQDALLCCECSKENFVEHEESVVENYRTIFPLIHGVRSYGTAAYGMVTVASGATDAYFEIGPHLWDVAAASIIVTEAGGVVMDTAGGPFDIMSRRFLAEEITKNIRQYSLPRDDE